MFLKRLLVITVFGAILNGCTTDSTSDLIDATPITGTVTYTQNVKPIIDNVCLSCHGVPPVNNAPISLNTYQKVKDAMLSAGLLDRISRQTGQTGLMPQGGPRLPQNSIDIIAQWQADGLQE